MQAARCTLCHPIDPPDYRLLGAFVAAETSCALRVWPTLLLVITAYGSHRIPLPILLAGLLLKMHPPQMLISATASVSAQLPRYRSTADLTSPGLQASLGLSGPASFEYLAGPG